MIQRHKTTSVRKDQIVNAAKKLIIKHGSENLTVRAIANEVDLSEGALYRHFKSKRDILALLADTIEADLLGDIKVNDIEGESYSKILDSILRGHLSAIKQRQGISFQVIAMCISFGDKKLNKRLSEIINKYIEEIKTSFARG